jgi:outer membrane protein
VNRAAILVLVVAAAATLAAPAGAQGDRWIARVRGLGVIPDYHSDVVGTTETRLKVDNSFGAEASLTYFIRPQWGLELSAWAAPVDLVTVGGQAPGLDAGSVDLVTGMLALQYHFATTGRVKPYLGIGMALAVPTGYSLSHDMASFGISELTFTNSLRVHTQIGADLQLGKGWRLNFDVRYVPVATNVDFRLAAGGTLATIGLNINPILVGIGVGRSF